MSAHDTNPGDEQGQRSLAVALADLADTMPSDPYRVDGIHAKARRLRTRRRVTRTAGAVVVGVATVAALVAVRPGTSDVTTLPAGQPSAATLPVSCTADPDSVARLDKTPDAVAAEADARAAKLAAAGGASASGTADRGLEGVKGFGTVVSAADGAVTITLDEPLADEPSEITASVRPDAEFMDGAAKIESLPALSPGEQVAFAASKAGDGAYEIFFLGVNVASGDGPAASPDADVASSDVKAAADVVSVQPDSLTLAIREGSLAGETVNAAIGPDTLVTAGDHDCVDAVLAAGDEVGTLLAAGADGTYTIKVLALPSTAAKP